MNEIEQFEKETDLWIEKKLGFANGLSGKYFHFTNSSAAKAIYETKTFRASFIRSTSDPLEFALPLSICRNWMVSGAGIFVFPNYPDNLFKHFNEISNDPTLRPYFISMCDHKNKDLIRLYGDSGLLLNFNGDQNTFYIKCRYTKNPVNDIKEILDDWISSTELKKQIPKNDKFSSRFFGERLYIFMKVFHLLSTAIKDAAFEYEKETRLLFLIRHPDSPTELYQARVSECHTPKFHHKEYLPINLDKMGVSFSII